MGNKSSGEKKKVDGEIETERKEWENARKTRKKWENEVPVQTDSIERR